jgi:2-hydroxychromene-2-carboxylate isomerase
VFRAIWVDAKNMNDPATVGAVLQPPASTRSAAGADADPEVKDRLKTVTQDAVARGVFGAPTFFIDGRMYWGQDRLDFVSEALQ